MNTNRYFYPLVLVLLVLSGCTSEIVPPVTLELADYTTIDFPTQGGEREVAVETNQTEWTAISEASWLVVDQRANTVILKAAPNSLLEQRQTSVLVTAGGLSRRIDVTQMAEKSTLDLTGEALLIPDGGGSIREIRESQFGGTASLDVLTEDPNWSYEIAEGASWIKADKVTLGSKLLITIAENSERAARTGIIFVRTKDQSIKLNVQQEGTLYYLLPLLTPESTKEQVKDFEEARHSRVVQNASYLSGGAHTYHTVSPLFYEIKYSFDRRNLREVIMQCQTASEMLDDEFTKLLEEAGFEYKADSGMERVFIKKVIHNGTTYEIFANLAYGLPSVEPMVVFNIMKRQQGPMPTFDHLPDGIGEMGLSRQQVLAWESTHGGTYSDRNSDREGGYYFFDVLDKTYIGRDYLFQDDKLVNMRIFTYDISKFFYSPAKGTFKMTDEFKDLLQREGFTETRQTGDIWERFYINRARKMAVSARVTSFATVLSGQPLVVMLYIPFEED